MTNAFLMIPGRVATLAAWKSVLSVFILAISAWSAKIRAGTLMSSL